MLPHNPHLMEKLARARQEDLLRGIPHPASYDLQNQRRSSTRPGIRPRIWLSAGFVLAVTLLIAQLAK